MENINNQGAGYDDRFTAVLKLVMNMPGVHIRRDDFLKKELSKRFTKETVEAAIERSPAYAGITVSEIHCIAKASISLETKRVSAISTAMGIPGGIAMVGTVSGDIIQYFAHVVRILQKLAYLYGWDELYDADEELNDETINILMVFIGVMFGVNSANVAINKIAQHAALKIEKNLANKALTKTAFYPLVKKAAQKVGYTMTKEIFAKNVGKLVPVLGGLISGTLTYASFRVMAANLKGHLENLPTADVEFYKNNHDYINETNLNDIFIEETEFVDIDVEDESLEDNTP